MAGGMFGDAVFEACFPTRPTLSTASAGGPCWPGGGLSDMMARG